MTIITIVGIKVDEVLNVMKFDKGSEGREFPITSTQSIYSKFIFAVQRCQLEMCDI